MVRLVKGRPVFSVTYNVFSCFSVLLGVTPGLGFFALDMDRLADIFNRMIASSGTTNKTHDDFYYKLKDLRDMSNLVGNLVFACLFW